MNRLTGESLKFPIPVTCLHRIDCAGFQILLVGTGGVLEAINLYGFSSLCDSGSLLTQTVRCLVPVAPTQHGETRFTQGILVQGGSQVAWVELYIEIEGPAIVNAHFKTIYKCRLEHWMIRGQPSSSPGITATFLSSYNVLYHVKVNTNTRTLECYRLNDKLTTFLYSGDFTETDINHYLVASGTAFGKVLVWSSLYDEQQGRWMSFPRQEFEGHQGSIFGVSISNLFQLGGKTRRIMASCSDDRTIRIWDVSDAIFDNQKHFKDASQHDQIEYASELELAKTWAHASRIWNVDMISAVDLVVNQSSMTLVSTGEDATAQNWSLILDNLWQGSSQSQQIWKNRYADNHHSGKNIWSRCYTNDEKELSFYTGGGDGQIVVRSYNTTGRADQSAVRSSQMFREISIAPESNSITPLSGRKPLVLKSYIISNTNHLLATTDSGLFLKGTLHKGAFVWQILLTGSQALAFVLCRQLSAGVAFLVDTSNDLLLGCDTTTSKTNILCKIQHAKVAAIETAWSDDDAVFGELCTCLAVSYFGSSELDLVWLERRENGLSFISKSSFCLPQVFEVTSTCYDPRARLLLAGSRTGAIVVYTNASSTAPMTAPACCKKHIHSSDTVTSIQKLCEDSLNIDSERFYLTTGRDGTYCVVQIVLASPLRMRVVHQTTPPLGPNIEGAHLIQQSGKSKKLLLHGFQSTNFVVWDDSHQTQVMSVDCGGAHRNWAFSRNDAMGENSTFVWTKAGTLIYHHQAQADHKSIRSGGHGREIKALAVTHVDEHRTLIATGSEDTDIRLFELRSYNTTGRHFECLSVLRRHTTGLQDLKFSCAGNYLFSAAGMEELYAWRLTAVPVIEQGVCFAGALPKHDVWSDARIMSIDVHDIVNEATSARYILVGAFSNGKLKIIEFTASLDYGETGTFTVLNQLDCGAICLTQAQFLDSRSNRQDTAVVAGTNGSVSVFHTGGIVRCGHRNEPQDAMPLAHKIHQNSITALQAIKLTSTIQLLLTGGDDNALAISLCQLGTDTDNTTRVKTLIIPKAHTAALTALVVLNLNSEHEPNHKPESDMRHRFMIVTAGNDQRVKTWGLKIDPQHYESALCDAKQQKDAMEYIEVEPMEDVHTNVADISEVEVLQRIPSSDVSEFRRGTDDTEMTQSSCERVEVLVVGVGMEVVSLEIPCSSS